MNTKNQFGFLRWVSLLLLVSSTWLAAKPLDKIVAIANHNVITESQLQEQILNIKTQLEQMHQQAPADLQLRQQALQQLIDESLEMQKAKELGIKVDDKIVDTAIEDIAKRNKATVADLKKMLAERKIPYEQYREMIRKQMTISKLQQQAIGAQVSVNKEEVKRFLQEANAHRQSIATDFHLVDILVPADENASAKQKAAVAEKARGVLAALRKTKSVAEFLKNPANKGLEVNDLGWRALPQLPELFAREALMMRPGEFKGLIAAPNGFHILQLVESKGKQEQPQLTEAEAEQMVYGKKFGEAVNHWLRQLRAVSYVKVM